MEQRLSSGLVRIWFLDCVLKNIHFQRLFKTLKLVCESYLILTSVKWFWFLKSKPNSFVFDFVIRCYSNCTPHQVILDIWSSSTYLRPRTGDLTRWRSPPTTAPKLSWSTFSNAALAVILHLVTKLWQKSPHNCTNPQRDPFYRALLTVEKNSNPSQPDDGEDDDEQDDPPFQNVLTQLNRQTRAARIL